jgi:hypothetical protein
VQSNRQRRRKAERVGRDVFVYAVIRTAAGILANHSLIERGIDLTIKDYRWESNAAGVGAPRPAGREDGSVARGGGTAAGEGSAMSTSQSTRLSISLS